MKNNIRKNSSARLISAGFFIVIMIGALLLMTPMAVKPYCKCANFADALFTATSATCVTGLIVKDTATYWSTFGQSVILCLIQIGGMGVISITILFYILSKRKIGIAQRNYMKDSIAAQSIGGIVKNSKFLFKGFLLFELSGMFLMSPVFIKDSGVTHGIWKALFTAVSAFCNAGFDLNGDIKPYSSLSYYSDNFLVNITVMLLIIIGGLGFLVWHDITLNKLAFKKYKLQTKTVIITTLILIIFPAIYFYFAEFKDGLIATRILKSLFQSVTPRTAGFNTANLTNYSLTAKTVTIILMLIGGSPGSTAGGMKTTTIVVLLVTAISVFKREEPNLFHRRIEDTVIRKAIAISMVYICASFTSAVIISVYESLPFITCLFESASAIGTVGLTLGITPSLGLLSKIVLIMLMFIGRVGGLTLIFAAIEEKQHLSKYPIEKIMVG